ncbi:MAG: hypothetical protein JNJ61_26470 [Anaerolineae bacterium]|nr:hypothetical protein [Anaerolineae bacterium]
MSIKIGWDSAEQQIVRLEFQRGWTWDTLNKAIQRADDLIISVPHTVHLIIDIRNAGGLPGDFMTRAGDIFAQGDARPNEGKKVVVGAGPLIRAAYSGFLAVYGHKLQSRPFHFASSLDEARDMVE